MTKDSDYYEVQMRAYRFFLPCFALCLLLLPAVCIQADTVTGSGSWQSWNPSVLGTAANPTTGTGPFWNNASGDGPASNIGWCLVGGGGCQIANPPGALNYFGNGTAAPSSVSFSNAGAPDAVTLLGLFTNQNGVPPSGADYFGWYSVSSGIVTMHPLLNSTEGIGTVATFLPTASYGFYLENVQTAGLTPPASANYYWFTDASLDYANSNGTIDPNSQHFAIFGGSTGTYYLGMEDTPNGDFDYNDMIVNLQSTPEPGTFWLFGASITALTFAVWRRSTVVVISSRSMSSGAGSDLSSSRN